MDIVMTGRNVDVPAHYRVHVTDKLARLQRYDNHLIRYDVELDHENNPRQSKACQRVEITGTGKGPTVRAEACGPDFYTALDAAVSKLEARLRRSHDRRRVHRGRHQPTSVGVGQAAVTNGSAAVTNGAAVGECDSGGVVPSHASSSISGSGAGVGELGAPRCP